MTRDEIVLESIGILCDSVGRLNETIDSIIEDIPMSDEDRAAMKSVSNDLRVAYAMLQTQNARGGAVQRKCLRCGAGAEWLQ